MKRLTQHGSDRTQLFSGGVLALGLANAVLLLAWHQPLSAQVVDFEKQVAPILVSHCLECHRGTSPEGGLSLTDWGLLNQGGESGPVVKAGDAVASHLWERVRDDEMPPQHPLSDDQKQILRRWIDQGAPWSGGKLDLFSFTTETRAGLDWWSLQPLQERPAPPADPAWGRNEIDAFVLTQLKAAQLHPSPEAEPRTLIRRLYFDLIGLPPAPEEVAAFASDPSDSAYEAMVERLLSSPHYGER